MLSAESLNFILNFKSNEKEEPSIRNSGKIRDARKSLNAESHNQKKSQNDYASQETLETSSQESTNITAVINSNNGRNFEFSKMGFSEYHIRTVGGDLELFNYGEFTIDLDDLENNAEANENNDTNKKKLKTQFTQTPRSYKVRTMNEKQSFKDIIWPNLIQNKPVVQNAKLPYIKPKNIASQTLNHRRVQSIPFIPEVLYADEEVEEITKFYDWYHRQGGKYKY